MRWRRSCFGVAIFRPRGSSGAQDRQSDSFARAKPQAVGPPHGDNLLKDVLFCLLSWLPPMRRFLSHPLQIGVDHHAD